MTESKRKVCVVVASRANYGRIKAVLRALRDREDVELQIVATASALLYRFGRVVEDMEADGFAPNMKVHIVLEGDSPVTMAKSTGIAILELSTVFEALQPDVVVTVADRYETLATAVAASYMNIPLAHTQGGELTGSIDESVRHAITKLANYHFVTNETCQRRVIQMGESPETVLVTGCPSIDAIANIDLTVSLETLWGGVGAVVDPSKPFLLVLQHPVTTESNEAADQIRQTIAALKQIALPTIWLWPNVDSGSDAISKELRMFREHDNPDWLHFHINFSVEDYARILAACACIVGNSSSAIREGSYLGTPAVNIGSRQASRERADNVFDVPCDRDAIESAIRAQIEHGRYSANHMYGDGRAAERIASNLANISLGSTQKRFYEGPGPGQ